jgi:ParB family chromosome partitioning protein
MAKPALGRGLGALLGGQPSSRPPATPSSPTAAPVQAAEIPAGETVLKVPISKVFPCSFQPRKQFTEEALQELAESIREQGIIQPLIVRPRGERYELIAGERRWRAAQIAQITELPVIIREADDRTVLELALVENLQRENLNPIEEALGYSQLIEQFSLTQEQAATKVGKSRAVVANALRLLKFTPEIQDHIRHGRLSVGHAKVLLGLGDSPKLKRAVEEVLRDSLNVRQTEALVARLGSESISTSESAVPGSTAPKSTADIHILDLQNKLQEKFGTKVQLRYRDGKGSLEIRFFNDDDLERILKIAGIDPD